MYRLKNYFNGVIPESLLQDEDKKLLSLFPQPSSSLTGIETVTFMENCSELINHPLPIYRKLNLVIRKVKEKNKNTIPYPSESQIKALYNIVDIVDNRFFVGFVDDSLLLDENHSYCEDYELRFFMTIDIVYIRNSFLEETNISKFQQKCKMAITTAILSYRRINFYHRKLVYDKVLHYFPDEKPVVQKRERTETEEDAAQALIIISKKQKTEWCSTSFGSNYCYAWRLVFTRNSPVCLSEKGKEYASKMRFGKKKDIQVTNGKSMESEYARIIEHFIHLIDKVKDNKVIILKWYVIFKLFRALDVQLRYTDDPEEQNFSVIENLRKNKVFKLNNYEDKVCTRPQDDQDEVNEQIQSLYELMKMKEKKVLPSMKTVYKFIEDIFDSFSNDQLLELRNITWDMWDSNKKKQKLDLAGKILSCYFCLLRKAPSFFLNVDFEFPVFPTMYSNNVESFKTETDIIIKNIFSHVA